LARLEERRPVVGTGNSLRPLAGYFLCSQLVTIGFWDCDIVSRQDLRGSVHASRDQSHIRGSVHGPDRAVGAFVPLPSASRSSYVFFSSSGFFFEKFSSSVEMCSSDTLRYRPSTTQINWAANIE
jgi:hypothetical protein